MLQQSDYEGFYVIWLDEEGEEITEEWLDRATLETALKTIALRVRQSPSKCPQNIAGFYIERAFHWRQRKGLTKARDSELDKQVKETIAKYGKPPDE